MAYVNVAQLIDRSRLHSAQVLVLVLCGLCMVMDGFDVQAMGYVAPAIINEWHVAKPALGPIFGELREAGRELLEQRRLCYEQQADSHSQIADNLTKSASMWEAQDAESAQEIKRISDDGR